MAHRGQAKGLGVPLRRSHVTCALKGELGVLQTKMAEEGHLGRRNYLPKVLWRCEVCLENWLGR